MGQSVSLATWALASVSICLSAAAQVLMKIGMSGDRPAFRSPIEALFGTLLNPHVFAGLSCYVVSAGLWLLVLARMPLSLAYPLVAMAIVLVVLASTFLLGESLPIGRIIGASLIVVGVALVGLRG